MHVTLQTLSVNPAEVVSAQSAGSLVNNSPEILLDLNLVFSVSIVVSLRAPVQPVRGPRGSSRRAPPKEEELKQHHLNRGHVATAAVALATEYRKHPPAFDGGARHNRT